MTPEYIYLIVAVVLIAVVALFAIWRYKKLKMKINLPGGISGNLSGETEDKGKDDPGQPAGQQQAGGPSATTTIGGSVKGSTVVTDAGGKGQAKTGVGGDVEKSDILTEA